MSYRDFIKRAGATANLASTCLYNLTPITGLANSVGGLYGYIKGRPTQRELREMDASPALSYIPGVGAHRLNRMQLDAIRNERPLATAISENGGPLTSSLLLAAAGAGLGGIGAALTGGKVAEGAALGAGIGALTGGAASTAGVLAGILRKRRTAAEAAKSDAEESLVSNYLVPGVAAYRAGRRLRDIYRREDERNARA